MAHETKVEEHKPMDLPVSVTSIIDVGRLVRELEVIDNALLQLGLRSAGDDVQMPKTSHLMDQTIELNKLNLLQKQDRASLAKFLNSVRQSSPTIHMSFSSDPSPAFIEKLMVWLRQNIHPLVLLTVGLQPNIGAGCIIRTTNKQFDISLRKSFSTKRELLAGLLSGPAASQPVQPAIKQPEAVA